MILLKIFSLFFRIVQIQFLNVMPKNIQKSFKCLMFWINL